MLPLNNLENLIINSLSQRDVKKTLLCKKEGFFHVFLTCSQCDFDMSIFGLVLFPLYLRTIWSIFHPVDSYILYALWHLYDNDLP